MPTRYFGRVRERKIHRDIALWMQLTIVWKPLGGRGLARARNLCMLILHTAWIE